MLIASYTPTLNTVLLASGIILTLAMGVRQPGLLDAADLAGARLDARNLFAGAGHAKPDVGPVRPVRRTYG